MNVTTNVQQIFSDALVHVRTAGLQTPATILFGRGVLDQLTGLLPSLMQNATAVLVSSGGHTERCGLEKTVRCLLAAFAEDIVSIQGIRQEPVARHIDELAAQVRAARPGLVVSLGGGSVIDTGKALAALATNDGSVEDYLEGVGKGLAVSQPPVPHIAIPTVAGTGAEMTKNAVIGSIERQYKKSLRADRMIPSAAVIDPCLSLSVPQSVTAAGGMDAITQLIESCITRKRRRETTALATTGLRLVRASLKDCYAAPSNLDARERVALASSLGGICLANSGLAMAHGIAAALGARHGMAHGLACGILLPHTLRFNRDACREELSWALAAFLNRLPSASAIDDGIDAIAALNRDLGIPPDLKFLALDPEAIAHLAQASMGTSMSGNPIPMDAAGVQSFLQPLC